MTYIIFFFSVYFLLPLLCTCWWILYLPFPFINIGCKVKHHKLKYFDNNGVGEVFWFGHFKDDGTRLFKYVEAYTVKCTKCGLIENRLKPNIEDLRFAKKFMGENAYNSTTSPFNLK
jgi:hypothetical protein